MIQVGLFLPECNKKTLVDLAHLARFLEETISFDFYIGEFLEKKNRIVGHTSADYADKILSKIGNCKVIGLDFSQEKKIPLLKKLPYKNCVLFKPSKYSISKQTLLAINDTENALLIPGKSDFWYATLIQWLHTLVNGQDITQAKSLALYLQDQNKQNFNSPEYFEKLLPPTSSHISSAMKVVILRPKDKQTTNSGKFLLSIKLKGHISDIRQIKVYSGGKTYLYSSADVFSDSADKTTFRLKQTIDTDHSIGEKQVVIAVIGRTGHTIYKSKLSVINTTESSSATSPKKTQTEINFRSPSQHYGITSLRELVSGNSFCDLPLNCNSYKHGQIINQQDYQLILKELLTRYLDLKINGLDYDQFKQLHFADLGPYCIIEIDKQRRTLLWCITSIHDRLPWLDNCVISQTSHLSDQKITVTNEFSGKVIIVREGEAPTDDIYLGTFIDKLIDNTPIEKYIAIDLLSDDINELDTSLFIGAYVVVSRYINGELLQTLTRQFQHTFKVAYLIDDDLLAAFNSTLLPASYRWRMSKRAIRDFLFMTELADEVIVINEFLFKKYQSAKTKLLPPSGHQYGPNFISDKLKTKKPTERIKIFYHGTRVHSQDLDLLAPTLFTLLEKYEHIDLEIGCQGYMPEILAKHPRVNILPNLPWPEFKQHIKDNHGSIGLAPVLDTPYNRGKSVIKYFDIAAYGAFGIYSNLAPYNQFINNDIDGILVDNDPALWMRAISYAVDNYAALLEKAAPVISEKSHNSEANIFNFWAKQLG